MRPFSIGIAAIGAALLGYKIVNNQRAKRRAKRRPSAASNAQTLRAVQPATLGLGGGGAMYHPVVSPHDSSLMFVACDMSGLYRSTDRGQQWKMLDGRLSQGSARFSVACDPRTPGHILAFHPIQGLRESFDGGVAWQPVAPALPLAFPASGDATLLGCAPPAASVPNLNIYPVTVTAAAVCPDSAGRVLIGTPRGIFVLHNGSWVWVHPSPGPAPDSTLGSQVVNPTDVIKFVFVTDPGTSAVVYFAATTCDVLRSDDQGLNWRPVSGNLPARPLGQFRPDGPSDVQSAPGVVDPIGPDPNYLPSRIRGFAGGSNAGHFMLYATIATDADIANSGGVYFYDSNANPVGAAPNWQRAMQGAINTSPAIAPPPGQPDDRNGLYLPRYEHLGASETNPDVVYVTALNTTYHAPAVYRGEFRNNNVEWSGVYDGFQNHMPPDPLGQTNVTGGWLDQHDRNPPIGLGWGFGGFAKGFAVAAGDANTALFSNNGVVHLTTDGGQRWTQCYSALAAGNAADPTGRWRSIGLEVTTSWNYMVHPDPAKTNLHFICYTDIGLARSEDAGVSWRSISQSDIINSTRGANRRNFYELAFEPDVPASPQRQRIWAAVSDQHDIPHETQHARSPGRGAVLASEDDGATWFTVSDNTLPSGPVVSIIYQGQTLYASVWGQGVYQSADRGATWTATGNFPPGTHVYRLQFANGTLHCVVAASRVGGFQAGGLYAFFGGQWQKLTDGLDTLLGTQAALLAPTDFAFHPTQPGVFYLCTASVRGSNGGGGVYHFDGNAWLKVNIPFPATYHDTVRAFAPFFVPTSDGGTALCVTTTSHGFWFTRQGLQPPDQQMWQEIKDIPFLSIQRLSVLPQSQKLSVTTFGGGVWSVDAIALDPEDR